MRINTALQVLAGTISEFSITAIQWSDLGYGVWEFNELGKPSWFDVKQQAVEVITNEFSMLRERIETLEDKIENIKRQ